MAVKDDMISKVENDLLCSEISQLNGEISLLRT
jgi:hypothetical protein